MALHWVNAPLAGLFGLVLLVHAPTPEPASPGLQAKKTEQEKTSLADQVKAIAKEGEDLLNKYRADRAAIQKDGKLDAEMADKTAREYVAANNKLAARLTALVKDNAKDPAAFGGIQVLVVQLRQPLDQELAQILIEHHLNNPGMGRFCFDLAWDENDTVEKLLKEVAAKHPDKAVRGQAVYALGMNYRYRVESLGPKAAKELESAYLAKAAKLFTEVAKNYADEPTPDGRIKLGVKATGELARIANIPNLKVGKVAPEIIGEDIDGKGFKLSDYRGKVVVLDFWGHW